MSPLKTTILVLASLLGGSPAMPGGDIKGRIFAEIHTDAEDAGGGGAYASRRYRFLEKIDYAALKDFVVYIEEVEHPVASGTVRASVSQINGMFEPHVMPITKGTTIVWPNKDSIFHNVFSMSESTPFDLGYYKDTDDPKEVTFMREGRVDVFCSIHSEMNCIVLVLPNPWFAIADRDGHFTIKDVPPGTYQLRGWQERLPARSIEVVVPSEGTVEVSLPLGLGYLPKM